MNIVQQYPDVVRPWHHSAGFPWPGLQFARFEEPFGLDCGATLPGLTLAWEEWGPVQVSEPAVLIFHALTGDSHVASHGLGDRPGWWEGVVGAGKAVDTRRWRVVAANVLGGAMGSTGPSSRRPDGRPWGSAFPEVSLFDMARAIHRLVEALGIGRVHVVGGSMGGMIAYAYAALYGDEVASLIAIGAPVMHSPWAIAYHVVGRTAIANDPAFRGGDYYDHGPGPEVGLAVARMADMISYQSPESMERKFGRQWNPDLADFEVASYLRYQGEKLVRRFDANTYLCLTSAMDRFDLREHPVTHLAGIRMRLIGIESDMLYPLDEIRASWAWLRDQGVNADYVTLPGPWGHDTFLVEQAVTGRLIAEFLTEIQP